MCVLTGLFFKGLKQNVILIATNLSVTNLIVSVVATGNSILRDYIFYFITGPYEQ